MAKRRTPLLFSHDDKESPSLELGVDGPMEVHPLAQTLQRFRSNHHLKEEDTATRKMTTVVVVRFVVRLDAGSTVAQWESLLRATQEAICHVQQEETTAVSGERHGFYFEWAGISVDLSAPNKYDTILMMTTTTTMQWATTTMKCRTHGWSTI
eukprot:scaffold2706_cov43-Attheya_sp.AAC.2